MSLVRLLRQNMVTSCTQFASVRCLGSLPTKASIGMISTNTGKGLEHACWAMLHLGPPNTAFTPRLRFEREMGTAPAIFEQNQPPPLNSTWFMSHDSHEDVPRNRGQPSWQFLTGPVVHAPASTRHISGCRTIGRSLFRISSFGVLGVKFPKSILVDVAHLTYGARPAHTALRGSERKRPREREGGDTKNWGDRKQ